MQDRKSHRYLDWRAGIVSAQSGLVRSAWRNKAEGELPRRSALPGSLQQLRAEIQPHVWAVEAAAQQRPP